MPVLHRFLMQRKSHAGCCEFKARATSQVGLFFPLLLRWFLNLGFCLLRLNYLSCRPGSLPSDPATALLLQSCIWGQRGAPEPCCPWTLRRRQQASRQRLWALVVAQTPGEHDWRRDQDLGERWVLLTVARGLGVPGGWMLALERRLPVLDSQTSAAARRIAVPPQKRHVQKKSVLSGAREAEARGSRGVLGRRVSPSAHRANPPPRTPSTRREHPPRAGPWRRNPPLQHEVLSLRAQDAPGPPGQRHQVSGGRPHRRAGTFTIWGAPLGCHRLSVTFFWDEVSERLAEGRWVPEWAILKCRIRSPQETVRTTRSKLNDGPGELGFFPKVCERGDRGGYGGLLRQLYEMQPRSHPRYIQVSSVPFIALTTFPYLFFLHTLQPHFHCPSPNTPTHTHTHTLTLTVCLSHTHTNVCSWRQGLCLSYSWARREPGQ